MSNSQKFYSILRVLIAPDYRIVKDSIDANEIWKKANRSVIRSWRGMATLTIGIVVCSSLLVWVAFNLPRLNFVAIIFLSTISPVISTAIYFLLMGKSIRKKLRAIINQQYNGVRLCESCGYDLQKSLPTGRCPECGWQFQIPTEPLDPSANTTK